MRRAREERTCALHACEQRSCACALEGGRGGGGGTSSASSTAMIASTRSGKQALRMPHICMDSKNRRACRAQHPARAATPLQLTLACALWVFG